MSVDGADVRTECHLALAIAAGHDIVATRMVRGFAHACSAAGLTTAIWRPATARPRSVETIWFGRAIGTATALEAGASEQAPILFPLPETLQQLDGNALRDREAWAATAAMAVELRRLGAVVREVGACVDDGKTRFRSRASFALRENDFVFVVQLADFEPSNAAAFRTALARRARDAAHRFDRVTFAGNISTATPADKVRWREWAQSAADEALVLFDGLDDDGAIALASLSDGTIVLHEPAWFPWWTIDAACRGHATIALPSLRSFAIDSTTMPHVVHGLADANTDVGERLSVAVGSAVQATRGSERILPNPLSDPLSSGRFAARAMGCRIVDALKAGGRWDRLLWSSAS
jgi:hypothetical protein